MSAETKLKLPPPNIPDGAQALGLSPEVSRELTENGFKFVQLPRIDWRTLEELKVEGAKDFSKRFQDYYPNLHISENVWQSVGAGHIPFPDATGYTVGIESEPERNGVIRGLLQHRLTQFDRYDPASKSFPAKQQGPEDLVAIRMGVTPSEAVNVIERFKDKFNNGVLSQNNLTVGLPSFFEARVLSMMDHGARSFRGGIDIPELTSTVDIGSGKAGERFLVATPDKNSVGVIFPSQGTPRAIFRILIKQQPQSRQRMQ